MRTGGGFVFDEGALPWYAGEGGHLERVGVYSQGAHVFPDDASAFEYLLRIAKRDLEYRGMREDRVRCFEYKQRANFLLNRLVSACTDETTMEMYRQSWGRVNYRL